MFPCTSVFHAAFYSILNMPDLFSPPIHYPSTGRSPELPGDDWINPMGLPNSPSMCPFGVRHENTPTSS